MQPERPWGHRRIPVLIAVDSYHRTPRFSELLKTLPLEERNQILSAEHAFVRTANMPTDRRVSALRDYVECMYGES